MIIGVREIEKAAREGRVEKIIVASNCPEELRKRYESLRDFASVEFSELREHELSVKYGKPFPVSAVAIERDNQ